VPRRLGGPDVPRSRSDYRTGAQVDHDIYRAEKIASGFEQLDVQRNYGVDDYYWAVKRPRLGQLHPIEADVRAELQAEVDRLMAIYLAEVNA
jgi:hypothetical protein